MKKVFAFISILAVASAAFAEVTAKKLADGKVEATFFYGNPRATEVLLAGSFTDWQNGALPMEKGDKGFTLTKVFDAGTTVKYKFISDGNWTTDLKAPDFIDDGFGGKNSCADLDAISSGGDEGTPKTGIKFQTWSNFGYQQTWSAVDVDDDGKYKTDFDAAAAGIGLKSYWKFGGTVVPHVPVYVEIALAENESFDNIYKKDTLDWDDGLQRAATDIAFDPIYFLTNYNGSNPLLGHFKTGVETGWVDWTTGYKYAKLSPHYNVNWTTVDKDWDAGYNTTGGFNIFTTGYKFKELVSNATDGNVELELIASPNRTADRAGSQYGFFGIVDATLFGSHYVDLQYNGAYGTKYDEIFDTIYENDIIVGYKGTFGPVMLKANGLVSLWGSEKKGDTKIPYNPASSDVKITNDDAEFIDNLAANVNATFSNDVVTANVGYRFRGDQANMMYVKQADGDNHISDQLGDRNTQRVFGDVEAKITDSLKVGVNSYFDATFAKGEKEWRDYSYADKDTFKLVVTPRAAFALSDNMTIDGYGEIEYKSEEADEIRRGSEMKDFIFSEAGLHFNATLDGSINSVDVKYGFNANDDENDYAMHSLLTEFGVPKGFKVQAGFAVRTGYKDVDDFDKTGVLPVGFSVGTYKDICEKYKTTFTAQFVYGYNPYNDFGDKWCGYKMDNYVIDRSNTDYANMAALRVGLSFDF